MKSSSYFGYFIILLLIFNAISTGVRAQDTSKVGVKNGYSFTYNFRDTFPQNKQDLSPRLLYVRDNGGRRVYPTDGQKITITIEKAPSPNRNVVLTVSAVEGSARVWDKSNDYGQFVVYTDWQYWANHINSSNLFNDNAVVTVTNNATYFGSYHSYTQNSTSGDSYAASTVTAHLVYDKATGMLNVFHYDLTYDNNGTVAHYIYSLSLTSQKLESSSLTEYIVILVIAILVVIGFLVFLKYRLKSLANKA